MKKLLKYKPLSFFVNTKLYNSIYKKQIIKRIKKHESSPIFISIETTNICNADCDMCPHSIMKRKTGIMGMDLFKNIIGSAIKSRTGIKEFVLSGFGEPLLDKHIFERINYIKSKGKYYTKFFTNAALLDNEKINKLMSCGLDELVISFNGITRNSYEGIMKNLNYKKNLSNIFNLIEEKKICNSPTPKIVISCVRLTKNKDDIKGVLKFWKNKVNQVLRPIPENWSGNMVQNSPFKYSFKKKMWPCEGMWNTLDFLYDGRVSLCCRDYDGNVIIGDVSKLSVEELIGTKRKVGYQHLEGDYSFSPICYRCDTVIKNAISWW